MDKKQTALAASHPNNLFKKLTLQSFTLPTILKDDLCKLCVYSPGRDPSFFKEKIVKKTATFIFLASSLFCLSPMAEEYGDMNNSSSQSKQNSFSDTNMPQSDTPSNKEADNGASAYAPVTDTKNTDKDKPTTEAQKPIPNYSIKIASPSNEETFQNIEGSISVSVIVTPALEEKDKVVILLDGKEIGEPLHSTSFALPALERGEHHLQAKVIQEEGKGAESDTITILKLQPRAQ